MTRRILLTFCFLAVTCQRIYGAVSKWSWPGYPRESALRRHLSKSPNHRALSNASKGKSFEDLIELHDWDHQRRGDKPRWTKSKPVPAQQQSQPKPKSKPTLEPEQPEQFIRKRNA